MKGIPDPTPTPLGSILNEWGIPDPGSDGHPPLQVLFRMKRIKGSRTQDPVSNGHPPLLVLFKMKANPGSIAPPPFV